MTKEQLYYKYLSWLDGNVPLEPDQLFAFPLTNRDVTEDVLSLTNRLYFVVPDFQGHSMRLFVFFEENRFLKDDDGDLLLLHSDFFIPMP